MKEAILDKDHAFAQCYQKNPSWILIMIAELIYMGNPVELAPG